MKLLNHFVNKIVFRTQNFVREINLIEHVANLVLLKNRSVSNPGKECFIRQL